MKRKAESVFSLFMPNQVIFIKNTFGFLLENFQCGKEIGSLDKRIFIRV